MIAKYFKRQNELAKWKKQNRNHILISNKLTEYKGLYKGHKIVFEPVNRNDIRRLLNV